MDPRKQLIKDGLAEGYRPTVMIDNLKCDMSVTMWKGNHRLGGIMGIPMETFIEWYPSCANAVKEQMGVMQGAISTMQLLVGTNIAASCEASQVVGGTNE